VLLRTCISACLKFILLIDVFGFGRRKFNFGSSAESTVEPQTSSQTESIQQHFEDVLDEHIGFKFTYLAKLLISKAKSEMISISLNHKVDELERQYGVMERTTFGLEDDYAVPHTANETMEQETQINVRELQSENRVLRKKLEDCVASLQSSSDAHTGEVAEGIVRVRRLHEEMQCISKSESTVQGALFLSTPPVTSGRQDFNLWSHGPMPPPLPDLPGDNAKLGLVEWLELLRNDICNGSLLRQLEESRHHISELERTVSTLKTEHQQQTAVLKNQVVVLDDTVTSILSKYTTQSASRQAADTPSVEGQSKMDRMKAILEKAEQHLKEKVGQYSETDRSPVAGASPPKSLRPELQEGVSDTANAYIESHSMASSDSEKNVPVAVGLTVDCDFDENFRDIESTAQFNRVLQGIVSSSLGVPMATVHVLCHQRGSVIATVVLMGDEEDADSKTPSELAQRLLDVVDQEGEGLRAMSVQGGQVKKAELLGPIALPVYNAVHDAMNEQQARSVLAADWMAQEAVALKKQESALGKRFNFMHGEINVAVQNVESTLSGLSQIIRSRDWLKELDLIPAASPKSAQPDLETQPGKARQGSKKAVVLRTRSEECVGIDSREALMASVIEREAELPNESTFQKNVDVFISSIEMSSRSTNIAMLKAADQVLQMKCHALQRNSLLGKRTADEVSELQENLERVSLNVDYMSARLIAKSQDLQTTSYLEEAARMKSDQLRQCIVTADAEVSDLKVRMAELKKDLLNFRGRSIILQHRKDFALADVQKKLQAFRDGGDLQVPLDELEEKGIYIAPSSTFINVQGLEKQMDEIEELRRKCFSIEQELQKYQIFVNDEEKTCVYKEQYAEQHLMHGKPTEAVYTFWQSHAQIAENEKLEKLENALAQDKVKIVMYRQNEGKYKRDLADMQAAMAAMKHENVEAHTTILELRDATAAASDQSTVTSTHQSLQSWEMNDQTVRQIRSIERQMQSLETCLTSIDPQKFFALSSTSVGQALSLLEISAREARMNMLKVQGRINEMSSQAAQGESYRRMYLQELAHKENVINPASVERTVQGCILPGPTPPQTPEPVTPRCASSIIVDDGLEYITPHSEYAYMRAYSRLFTGKKLRDVEDRSIPQSEPDEQHLETKQRCDRLAEIFVQLQETAKKISGGLQDMELPLLDLMSKDCDASEFDTSLLEGRESDFTLSESSRFFRKTVTLKSKSDELETMLAEAKILLTKICLADSSMEAQIIRLRTKSAASEKAMNELVSGPKELEVDLAVRIGYLEDILSKVRRIYSQTVFRHSAEALKEERNQTELEKMLAMSKVAMTGMEATQDTMQKQMNNMDMQSSEYSIIMERQLQLSKQQCAKTQDEIEKLQTKLKAQSIEFESLKRELEGVNIELTSITNALGMDKKALRKEMERLVSGKDAAIEDLNKILGANLDEISELKRMIQETENDREDVNPSVVEAKALKGDGNANDGRILEQRCATVGLENELEKSRQLVKELEDRILGMSFEMSAAAQLSDRKKESAELKQKADGLAQQLAVCKLRLRVVDDENSMLRAHVGSDAAVLVAKMQEMQAELETSVETASRITLQSTNLKALSEALEAQQASSRAVWSGSIAQMIDAQGAMQDQISVLSEKLTDAEENTSLLKNERDQATEREAGLVRQMHELETGMLAVQSSLEQMQAAAKRVFEDTSLELAHAKTTIETLQNENETLSQQAAAAGMEDKLEKSRVFFTTSTGENKFGEKIAQWGCEWDCGYKGASFADVAEHEKTCASEKTCDLHKAQLENEMVKMMLKMRDELSELKTLYDTRITQLEDACTTLKGASDAESELVKAKDLIKQMHERMNSSILDLSTDLQESEARARKMEEECATLKSVYSGLELGVGSSRAAMAIMFRGKQDMAYRMSELSQKAMQYQQELAEIQLRKSAVDNELIQAKDMNQTLQNVNSELSRQRPEAGVEDELETSRQMVKELEDRILGMAFESSTAAQPPVAPLADVHKDLAESQQKADELEKQLAQAKDAIQELRGEKQEPSHQSSVVALEDALERSRTLVEGLENKILDMQSCNISAGPSIEVTSLSAGHNDPITASSTARNGEDKASLLRCEWKCGYKGASFEEVAQHEKNCGQGKEQLEDKISKMTLELSELKTLHDTKVKELEDECGALRDIVSSFDPSLHETSCADTERALKDAKASVKQLDTRKVDMAFRNLNQSPHEFPSTSGLNQGYLSHTNENKGNLGVGKDMPFAVALTLDRDYDDLLGDLVSKTEFNHAIQNDVSMSLGVPKSTVQVLCHQRGSIVAEVVLMGVDGEISDRVPEYDMPSDFERKMMTPERLAQQLVHSVNSKDSKFRSLPMGQFAVDAQMHGPVAKTICTAVQNATSAQDEICTAQKAEFKHAKVKMERIARANEIKAHNQILELERMQIMLNTELEAVAGGLEGLIFFSTGLENTVTEGLLELEGTLSTLQDQVNILNFARSEEGESMRHDLASCQEAMKKMEDEFKEGMVALKTKLQEELNEKVSSINSDQALLCENQVEIEGCMRRCASAESELSTCKKEATQFLGLVLDRVLHTKVQNMLSGSQAVQQERQQTERLDTLPAEERGNLFNAQRQWGCEWNCGFKGSFDAVSDHEKSCSLRKQTLESEEHHSAIAEMDKLHESMQERSTKLNAALLISTARVAELEGEGDRLRAGNTDTITELAQAKELIERLEHQILGIQVGCKESPSVSNNLNDSAVVSLTAENKADDNVVQWGCSEWNCGYKGTSFAEVAEHETTCGKARREDDVSRMSSTISELEVKIQLLEHECSTLRGCAISFDPSMHETNCADAEKALSHARSTVTELEVRVVDVEFQSILKDNRIAAQEEEILNLENMAVDKESEIDDLKVELCKHQMQLQGTADSLYKDIELNDNGDPLQDEHFLSRMHDKIADLTAKLCFSEAAREEGARQVGETENTMESLLQEVGNLKEAATATVIERKTDGTMACNEKRKQFEKSASQFAGLCNGLIDVVSELQDNVDKLARKEKRVQRALLIESGAAAVLARPGGKDLIPLLQKLRSDLDVSMSAQSQQRDYNRSREMELEQLRRQSSILNDQLQSLHGSNGMSPFTPRSPNSVAARSPLGVTMTPRAN